MKMMMNNNYSKRKSSYKVLVRKVLMIWQKMKVKIKRNLKKINLNKSYLRKKKNNCRLKNLNNKNK